MRAQLRSLVWIAAVVCLSLAGARLAGARLGVPGASAAASGGSSDLVNRDVQIATWNKALAADPASAIALGQLAGLHLQRARETGDESGFETAEHYARRSVALRQSRNGASFATLASALLARHDFAGADSIASALVAFEPEVPEYRAMLAEIKLERGDYPAAKVAFESLRGASTHLSVAPRLSRWMELTGRPTEARQILRLAVAEATRRPELPREQLAWFYLRAGDLDMRYGRLRGARSSLETGLRIAPADPRLLAALSWLELLSGNSREAIESGEQSLAIRLDPAALAVVGDAYAALGDRAKADGYYNAMELAVAGQPGSYHRAWSLTLLDHDRQVANVLANARREIAERRDVHGFDVLAWALYKAGRNGEARAAMAQSLRLGTRDATFYYHAGMIELAVGDTSRARQFLSRALAVNPNFHPSRPREIRALIETTGG